MGTEMIERERIQFTEDTLIFGNRVAYWFAREAQGWSALDEEIYWGRTAKFATLKREPAWTPPTFFNQGAA